MTRLQRIHNVAICVTWLILCASAWTFIPLWVSGNLTGCTTSQKAVAYQTLAATANTVDSALKAYADLVVAGKVDQATQIKVFDLKAKYALAFKAAVAAARGDMQAPTPTDVQNLADSLATLLRTILTP